MPHSRLVFVSNLGARYTEAGSNLHVIAMKAHAFTKTVKIYQKDPIAFIPKDARPPKSIKRKIRQQDTDAIAAWEAVHSNFTDPNLFRLFKSLLAADFNFLHASEKEARDFAVSYIASHSYKKLKSIKKLISNLRTFFRNIGREHSWQDRTNIEWNLETIGLSGNPITRATQDALITEVKRQIKARSQNTTNPITTTRQLNAQLASAHHSAPISAPAGIILVLYFVSELYTLVQKHKPSKDARRIVNMANLSALYTVLLHEACSAGDVTKQMTYNDIYFPLHTNISILTLALLPTATLAYIITNNLLSHYVIASYCLTRDFCNTFFLSIM